MKVYLLAAYPAEILSWRFFAQNKERKAKRAAELKKSKAKKEDVAAELARLDQDSKEEEKRVEARIFQHTLSVLLL